MVVLSEEEVTSSFPSSCSSSSSATPRWEYDVFLSFRGEDTRTNFTDHLYTALKEKGINTFRDDERLERGKPISEIWKAIKESKFAVIVLSRNYADSKWCLDELTKIVECMEKRGMAVLPVFYHVDPSDVRNQTGTFAKAFAEKMLRKRKICSMEKEETWRAALRKVGNLSGWHLRGDGHESEIILQIVEKIFLKLHDKFPRENKIVEEIFEKLCDTFPRVTSLVGIHSQVEHLSSLLCLGSDDIRVIGIWGMGGIGKTTLAKVVYDWFSSQFEGCSFIENVKDFSKESDLITLQQHLLADILEKKGKCIKNIDDGVNLIKYRLGSKKILLVLDDVNHLDQLKCLANERNWFGSGSRIIITTRDKQLLSAHKVDGLHECKILNNDDALQLLCLKAFEKEQPQEVYEEISWKIVDYVDGLPLALDVLGSLLACRRINHWNDTFKRLKQYPEAKIFGSLKLSYDGLDNKAEQKIFLYIACFLKGKNQGLVIDILESFGLCPKIGMDVLIKRSLVTISKDNIVWVHDLLQEMGWEILRKQSLAEPGNRIGLKFRKDIVDVLTNNEGTKAIEIIHQESSTEEVEDCSCNPKAFSKMEKLRFLRISNVLFPQGLEYLSNELRILEWHGYPLKSLPLGFQLNEIRKLDMRYSQIEKLWEGAMSFPGLKSIDLSCSKNLMKTPDLTWTPRLEALDLHGCTNLVEGHPSALVHKRLNYLNLAGCISLENLPSRIEMESLKTLILSNCSKVKRIPEFGKNMKCLEVLHLDGTAIEEIPPSIKHLAGLKHVNFSRCSKLGKRPEKLGEMHSSIAPMISLRSLEHLCRLEDLNLSWCNLFEIPNAIGCLSSLISLNLKGNNFVTLPASISQLSKLHALYLDDCKRLKSLLELPSSDIYVHNCTSLETLPQFLQISELGKRRKCLYYLDRSNCPKLIENDNSVAIVKRHLQEPNGRNDPLFTTTFASFARKIPQWFTHQRVGNYVSVELPPNRCDSTWMGFALCASLKLYGRTDFVESIISVFATTLLPNLQCIYPPMELILTCEIDTLAVWYVPKDTKAFELFEYIDCNQCSGHIIFYFETKGDIDKMECGVRLVNKEDVEELIQTTSQTSGSSIPPSSLNFPKSIKNENDISVASLKRHLQGPYGCKVPFFTNNYIRGGETPQWFTHQNVGFNSVSIELPPNWCDSTLLGFALYACFDISSNELFGCLSSEAVAWERVGISVSVMFLPDVIRRIVSKDHVTFYKDEVCIQAVWYEPKDVHEDFLYERKDRITLEPFEQIDWNQYIGNRFSGHIIFYFEVECGFHIEMNCGVRLVSKEDLEELIQTASQASGSSIPPCLNCPKLIENENYISVAILKRHLQEPYVYKEPFFTFNYTRGDEIPQWFTYQNVGNSINIELLPNWCDSTLLGFALYAHFDISSKVLFGRYNSKPVAIGALVSVSVTFLPDVIPRIVSHDCTLFYKDEVYSQAVWYVPKDRIAFEPFQQIDCNQYIIAFNLKEHYCKFDRSISFANCHRDFCDSDVKMKCGVRLVFKQDVEELKMIQPIWIDFLGPLQR